MDCQLLGGSEVFVEPDAYCTDASSLWTVKALDGRRLRSGMFIASLPFLIDSFPPVLLECTVVFLCG